MRSTRIRTAVGEERLRRTSTEASRRRVTAALGSSGHAADDRELQFVTNALELQLFDLLEDEEHQAELRAVAAATFQLARTLTWPEEPIGAAAWLGRCGCMAVLGERPGALLRIGSARVPPHLPRDGPGGGVRSCAAALVVWLRRLRTRGWEDLEAAQETIDGPRVAQGSIQP